MKRLFLVLLSGFALCALGETTDAAPPTTPPPGPTATAPAPATAPSPKDDVFPIPAKHHARTARGRRHGRHHHARTKRHHRPKHARRHSRRHHA